MAEVTAKKVFLKTVDGEYVLPYNGAVLSVNGNLPDSNGAIQLKLEISDVNGLEEAVKGPDLTGYVTKEAADLAYLGKNEKAASASTADSATTATNATNATNAQTAVKATQDGDGNVIPDTYVKKSQITSGADDLTAGESELSTGSLYFVYE